ncbi:MAG: type 4a pilus biogenesis protein PilO [Luminiphilus sp.]|jgi:type IV pilus assembly protein PilO|nr:type 4a pilus biogenesis protein PilO [Luminiphilus sp.]MDG1461858.1 type 4a pilus biogenesis protein PilO [Luminiphilus sp.]
MAIEDTLKSLRDFDFSDLDFENLGSWPTPVKVLAALALLMAVLIIGFYYHVDGLQEKLNKERGSEAELRRDFERLSFEAANLEAYKRQMLEMEESFGALVSQLPSDTEVPGLLEDITNKGEQNGLAISKIDLLPEVPREFYIELPISIVAVGSYHDLGAFISGMAGLPRIVTLHDFNIESSGTNTNQLQMNIVAKTYRYRDGLADEF